MMLEELARALDLRELTHGLAANLDADITRGYASDLLSDVLAHAPTGGVLVTLQVHLNVIAVASHAGLRAVIFSSGRTPDEEIVQKAAEEEISLFVSGADTFAVVAQLHEHGVEGRPV
jgi:hypothetical protein